VSPVEPPTKRRPSTAAWGLGAAAVGIASGAGGVVVARSAFGPGTAVAGAAIGLAAGLPASLWFSSSRRPRRRAPHPATGQGVRRHPHAVGWLGPVAGSALIVLAWTAVSHSSGSGWAQAVGALLAALLLTGLVAPLVPTWRAAVSCTASPSDGTAGGNVAITLVANSPLRLRPLQPPGRPASAGGRWQGLRPVTLELAMAHRGVVESVVVEVASSAPFGLVWWAKEVTVPLSRPLHVAPRLGTGDVEPSPLVDRTGDAALRRTTVVGETRGIRPYRAGDLRRAVHWPATAHTGALMVTESERPADQPVVVEVDLPSESEAGERAAERAMAVGTHYLVRGVPVLLITHERGGRIAQVVLDRVELGRRLARAVAVGSAAIGPATT
jgi:uncharacterized protein (DUF58 family)